MSASKDGGQAFPTEGGDFSGSYANSGMALRDYFAAAAMQGLLASPMPRDSADPKITVEWYVEKAFIIADVMLLERDKKSSAL